MKIRKLTDCKKFVAGDHCELREIFHPAKEKLKLRYSLAHAKVKPGQRTTPHRLKTSEVYYILSGRATMHLNHETHKVSAGYTVYIAPKTVQWIENTGKSDLLFLCIVDPAWRPQDEEILL